MVRRTWFNAECREAKAALCRVRRRHGHHAAATRAQLQIYQRTLRKARVEHTSSLEHMRLSHPRDFWDLLKPAHRPVEIAPAVLHAHYRELLEQLPAGYQEE
jgi:hypothetical protein